MNRKQRRATQSPAGPALAAGARGIGDWLDEAVSYHRAGRLADAEGIYRKILAIDANHADALHFLGLIAQASGHVEAAAQLIGKAVANAPGNPVFHNNLGNALRALGRIDEALAAYSQSVRLDRTYAAGHYNRGTCLLALGRPGDAATALEQSARFDPTIDCLLNLGLAYAQTGQFSRALAAYDKGLASQPDHLALRYNRANALSDLGRSVEAESDYRLVSTLRPDFAEAYGNRDRSSSSPSSPSPTRRALLLKPFAAEFHANLGAEYRAEGRLEEASRAYRHALALQPAHANAWSNLGNNLVENGDAKAGLAACVRALLVNSGLPAAHGNLGNALVELDRPAEAVRAFDQAIRRAPEQAEFHAGLGNGLKDLRQFDEALACYDRAASLAKPGYAVPLANKATLLLELGRMEDSLQAASEALQVDPNAASGWYIRSELTHIQPLTDADLQAMEHSAALLDSSGNKTLERILLHFSLGKAWMDAGESNRAFAHLIEGNRLKRGTLAYDIDEDCRQMREMAELFSADFLAGIRGFGAESARPIFIVGMPRSGTTLTEQILSSRQDVYGGGELPFLEQITARLPAAPSAWTPFLTGTALRAMGQDYDRQVAMLSEKPYVVDKLPANFRLAGLISAILPNARIIHCRRNPLDSCLSCFSKNFKGKLDFSYDLGDLGRYYRAYEALTDHWREVLPADRFLEIEYEEVVADIETEARRITGFLGLAWDPACLDFHRNRRHVRTSSSQVRRPIYRDSIDRWRPYAHHLGPLFDALGLDQPSASNNGASKG